MSVMGDDFLTPPTAPTNTATSAVSTAAVDIWGGSTLTVATYTFRPYLADVYILFGGSQVAAASTSNAYYVPAGVAETFTITGETHYFRVIATSAVANSAVSWFRSSP